LDFFIGKIFEGVYPPEAAVWCNAGGEAYIKEIEPMGSVRRFQIVKAPEPTDEELSTQARTERDRKIAKTDYYMMSDYPSNPQNLEELKVYRQALRDVPKQEGFPMDVRWPDVPKFLCKDSELESLGLAKVGI
jgi:hypothetical protein